ncbi:MAG TPA: DegT/DnrJ/EryC1/StrS family aminotransferase [Opitutaceae bacterium]|nr:DegT/DnrJ/EryC1/StrS family aminotransferase [Opitutaceae bacterium]
MSVPLLDLNRQNSALHAELLVAFERVMRSGHFILGPEVEAFEKEAAAFLESKHAIAVSSGTDAILVALMALDIGPGDEVICPAFTFFATAGCIARAGATPVFAEVRADSFNLDAADVARRVTSRTKAIMPVHLFGQSADMEPLLALARQHNLAIIEDAAQALGAKHRGRPAGTFGEFGTYSFFPSKNLGGFGDGGLVATNRDDLAEKVRLLRTHGAKPKYFHKRIGGNFRLDALQCALLRAKLPQLPAYCAARQRHAAFYSKQLAGLRGIALPTALPNNEHIWNQYTLRVDGTGRRDALRQHLTREGIGHEVYYPLSLHQQECFAHLPKVALPVSEQLAREVISIPVFPELTEAELTRVVAALTSWSN